MAHAYTPGLRVTRRTRLRRERRLPLAGQVLVATGDAVRRHQVVARAELPGEVVTVNVVNRLGIQPDDLGRHMLKVAGDAVREGEALARTTSWLRWLRTEVASPIGGAVESVSAVTGQVLLRRPPAPVELCAYVDGTVAEVLPGEGVVVETEAALVQGIFGVGGERWGTLRLCAESPEDALDPAVVDSSCAGAVVVVGGLVTLEGIERAHQAGAVAVVGGGIHDHDLRRLLGYDLGVAITGAEDIGLSLIVTEGFGRVAMARKTFDVLRSCDGHDASVCGATQIRAGVLRPEIIVTGGGDDDGPAEGGPSPGAGLAPGDPLRLIRAPWFGRIARVRELVPELRQIETGALVRVLEVEFEDGQRAVVPRANVERIEA